MADEPTTQKAAPKQAGAPQQTSESDTTDAPKTTAETEDPTSSDARHSTYREATEDELDNHDGNPPPGPHTIQERGEPSEDIEPKE